MGRILARPGRVIDGRAKTRGMTRAPLALVIAALCAGCGKKANNKPATPPPIEGLEALPAGVTRVVGGDVKKLMASRMVRRAVDGVLARDKVLAERIASLIESCGLEPGDNVTGFVIGLGPGPTDSVMAVRGKFVENSLAACVQKAMIDSGGKLVSVVIAGRSAYVAHPGQGEEASAPVYFAVGSPRSLVFAASEAWLARAMGEGKRMTDDPEMAGLMRRAPAGAALWAVGRVPDEVASGLARAAANEIEAPRSMIARIDLTDVFAAELRVEFPRVDDANKLKSLAQFQLPAMIAVSQRYGLGGLLQKLEVETEKNVVVLRVSATEEELSELLVAVDTADPSLQNPSSPDSQGTNDDQGNTASGDEAPVRQ
jgi:hypothetical protein